MKTLILKFMKLCVFEPWRFPLLTLFLTLCLCASVPLCLPLHAAPPDLITYQGRLKENDVPANGNRSIDIALCDGPGLPDNCYSNGPQNIYVSTGLFKSTFTLHENVKLSERDWYISLWVAGTELWPREKLTSAPYALFSSSSAYSSSLYAPAGTAGVQSSTSVFITGDLQTTGKVSAPVAEVGNIKITVGASNGYILQSDASGGASWVSPSAGLGDDMGDHTATTDLDMNSFQITGVSTITPAGTSVIIRPYAPNETTDYDYAISLGSMTYNNYGHGLGAGYNAYANYNYGVGIGADANNNRDFGTGVGYGATSNFNNGVGIGRDAYNNSQNGVGVGATARNNDTYGVGVGNTANFNNNYGVGVGNQANNNSNYGVGIGAGANGNSDNGVGVGATAYNNYDNGVGVGTYAGNNNGYAVGIGAYSKDNKGYGSALGAYSYANSSATALGSYAKANAYQSVAIGANTVNDSTGTASFGNYAVYTSSNIVAGSSITAQGGFYGNGSELTNVPGDNLGNHIATTTLRMGIYGVTTSSDITAAHFQISGNTVLAALPGTDSLGLGVGAGKVNTGNNNSFLGSWAGYYNTTGDNNSFLGNQAGIYTKTGSANAIFGSEAGYGVSDNSFSSSTLMGYRAGYGLTTGSDNLLLGFQSGNNLTTGNRNIIIGYDEDASAASASNELNIGGLIYGKLSEKTVGISTRIPNAALDVVSTGTASNIYAQVWRNDSGVIVATVTSEGKFYGDGSGLANVTTAGAADSILNLTDVNITADSDSNASGDIIFKTGSSEWMRVLNDGKIGVGIAAPAQQFQVLGNIAASTNLQAGGTWGATSGGIRLYRSDDVLTAFLSSAGDSFLTGGKVGIGTNTPTHLLEVNGQIQGTEYLINGTSVLERLGNDTYLKAIGGNVIMNTGNVGIATTSPTGLFQIGTGTFTVLSNGNVGIGTAAPSAMLAVSYVWSAGADPLTVWDPNAGTTFQIDKIGQMTYQPFLNYGSGAAVNFGNNRTQIGANAALLVLNPSAVDPTGYIFHAQEGGVSRFAINGDGNVGISTTTLPAKLTVNGGIIATSSITAQGGFYGNGSGLSGVITSPAGADLNMNGFKMINVSTLTFSGLDGGIALSPYIDAAKNYAYTQGIAIGSATSGNYNYGVGVGFFAYNNYNYGIGVGAAASGNQDQGVGVGYSASNNYSSGVGVGNNANNNNTYGVGVGYLARNNLSHGVGVGAYADGNANYAVGIGAYSQNNQPYGSALGAYSYAASSSVALGAYAKANAYQSVAIGFGTVNTSTGTASFGNYGVYTSTAVNAGYYQINGSTVMAILPGTSSLGVGVAAGRVNTGNDNSFLGYMAGYSNTTGGANSFLGYTAGYSNTTGAANSFLGTQAGYSNTTGGYNSFLGYQAGYYNTTGGFNSFLGYTAGYSNTTGGYNSFLGTQAGFYNTTGEYNSFLGTQAGLYNQTGSANTLVGYYAGEGTSGSSFSSSTIMGYNAGANLTTGSDNLLLGWRSGDSLTSGSRNIIIGYDEDASAASASNELNIGGLIYGNLSEKTIGISTRAPQAALDIVSTGTASSIYAQIWRDSGGVAIASMTSQGKLTTALGSGDNLGTHLASQDLNMAGFQITNISTITSAGIIISTAGAIQTRGIGYGAAGPGTRGTGAVDLQTYRISTSQIASGAYSVIGGGQQNTASNSYATVSGGISNTAAATYSTVGGGMSNSVSNNAYYSVIAGGDGNKVYGEHSAILGGEYNVASGSVSVIAGGSYNLAYSTAGFIGGGAGNILYENAKFSAIAGGTGNRADYTGSFVGGGWNNYASSALATVGGGYNNNASNNSATIAGGSSNIASHNYSAVTGGMNNKASGEYSFVGGGYNNAAQLEHSAVAGGWNNLVSSMDGFIGAGNSNTIDVFGTNAVIGGGSTNTVYGASGAILGGESNTIQSGSHHAVIVGGSTNTISATWGYHSSIVGGELNTVSSWYSFLGGGEGNNITGDHSFIGGGQGNSTSGSWATVAGGWANIAGYDSFVGGGYGNVATGTKSVVPGGEQNSALGTYSFAAGYKSSSTAAGTFTWGDYAGGAGVDILNNVPNRTWFKSSGGFIVTNSTDAGRAALNVSFNNSTGTVAIKGNLQLGIAGSDAPAPVTILLTNNWGSNLTYGDIVVIDTSMDNSVICQGIPSTTTVIGVVYDDIIGTGLQGRIAINGVAQVKTETPVTRGDLVVTSANPCRAQSMAPSVIPAGTAIGKWLEAGGGGGALKKAILGGF